MRKQKIRVLFLNFADMDNYHAQNLNAREIALRLDPECFQVTMLVAGLPGPAASCSSYENRPATAPLAFLTTPKANREST